MSEPTLDTFIEALEAFLHANIDVPLVHLTRVESAALLDQLRRLKDFDDNETRYAQSRHGANVTDCIGWLYLQKRNVEMQRDTAANMEARMFQAVIDHLQELHGRRAGADRAKAAERERREREAKAERDETMRRRQQRREQAKADYESQSSFRAEDFKKQYEEFFKDSHKHEDATFWKTFYGGSSDFAGFRREDPNARAREQQEQAQQQYQQQRQQRARSHATAGKWFEILGVSPTATRDEIKHAYRKLAAKFHPDRGGDATKMQEINVARDEGLAGLRA